MPDARRSLSFAFLGEDRSLGKTLNKVAGESNHAHGALSKLAKVTIGAGAIAGVTLLAHRIAKLGESTVDAYTHAARGALALQRLIGGTVEDSSRLQHAATETGVSQESLSKSLRILSKNLQAATTEVTKKTTAHRLEIVTVPRLVKGHIEYVKALRNVSSTTSRVVKVSKDLGFAYKDARGNILPMNKLLPNIAEHFKNMPNGVGKTALALKLFGRAGTEMLPLLNRGREGITELMKEADKLGLTMSGRDVQAVKQYTLEQRHFKASMEGLKITLGRELFPIFTAWTRSLNENAPKIIAWTRTHLPEFRDRAREVASFISTKLAPGVSRLVDGFIKGKGPGGALKKVLEGVGDGAKAMWDAAGPPFHWLASHPDMLKEVAKDAAILLGVLKAKAWLTGLGLLKSAGRVKLPTPGGGGPLGLPAGPEGIHVFVTNEGFGGGKGKTPPVVGGKGGAKTAEKGAGKVAGVIKSVAPALTPRLLGSIALTSGDSKNVKPFTDPELKNFISNLIGKQKGTDKTAALALANKAIFGGEARKGGDINKRNTAPIDKNAAINFLLRYGGGTAQTRTMLGKLGFKVPSTGTLPTSLAQLKQPQVAKAFQAGLKKDADRELRERLKLDSVILGGLDKQLTGLGTKNVRPKLDSKEIAAARREVDLLNSLLLGLPRTIPVTVDVKTRIENTGPAQSRRDRDLPLPTGVVPRVTTNTTNVNINKVEGVTLQQVLAEAEKYKRVNALSRAND